jgi:hypothetical protein
VSCDSAISSALSICSILAVEQPSNFLEGVVLDFRGTEVGELDEQFVDDEIHRVLFQANRISSEWVPAATAHTFLVSNPSSQRAIFFWDNKEPLGTSTM